MMMIPTKSNTEDDFPVIDLENATTTSDEHTNQTPMMKKNNQVVSFVVYVVITHLVFIRQSLLPLLFS